MKTVPGKWKGKSGSLSWWLPVQLSNAERYTKKIKPPDIEGIMKRREKILAHFDKLVAEKGEYEVLY